MQHECTVLRSSLTTTYATVPQAGNILHYAVSGRKVATLTLPGERLINKMHKPENLFSRHVVQQAYFPRKTEYAAKPHTGF